MQNIKDMRRTDWKRITKRRYLSQVYQDNNYDGVVALIKLDAISEVLYVKNSLGNDIKIVGEAYSWIEYAPKDYKWFLTAMFDEDGQFIQLYFDINSGNDFSDISNPTFVDMYLDIVVDTNGTITILDQKDLEEALEYKQINKDKYEEIISICNDLYSDLINHKRCYIDFCKMLYTKLNEELEGGKEYGDRSNYS